MSGNKPALNSVHLKYRKIHTSDLKYDDKFLERGTYGDVRKATWQERSVAVKMFSCAERKGGFSEELVCLSMLHEHANIVNLHGAHLGDSQTDRPFLVLEFAPYSLEKVLHQCQEELNYTVDNVMSWTVQMAIALEFIHNQQMLHRDIKPSNILLFEDGRVLKLCDFGTARKLETTLTNAVGTSWYMAPEVIRGTCYTASCDVYSFGVVLWEMITRHKPYLSGTRGKAMAPQSVLYRVATGGRPPMVARLPRCLEELIHKCWDEGSHKRPTTLEIKSKLEKLVKMIKIEMGKPFMRCRVKKAEKEAESGAEPAQEKSEPDTGREEGSAADTRSSSPSLSTAHTPRSSTSVSPTPPSIPSPTSQLPPSQSAPSLPSSAGAHRPSSILSSTPKPPPSSTHSRDHHQPSSITPHFSSAAALTRSEGIQFYKQQSSPAAEGARLPEAPPTGDPLSSSYPHGQLSPFLERRRFGAATPVSQSPGGQYGSSAAFSPPAVATPITHQDSNMSAMIEREGEEEDEVSQKQRQQWFQKVEEKSKSGEWDKGPATALYPKAVIGSSPFSIPGLGDNWQPVVPDTGNSESMQLFNQYKEAAQQLIKTNSEITHLTELCAKLDQEIKRDEENMERNKSSKDRYQALLNHKDVMVNELQRIKGQLNRSQTRY